MSLVEGQTNDKGQEYFDDTISINTCFSISKSSTRIELKSVVVVVVRKRLLSYHCFTVNRLTSIATYMTCPECRKTWALKLTERKFGEARACHFLKTHTNSV